MGYLSGLQEYLDEHYSDSIYKSALASGERYTFHAHDQKVFTGEIVVNNTYDIEIQGDDRVGGIIPKTDIKLVYPANTHDTITKQIKIDSKIANLKLPPLVCAKERKHVKNKSLYPLMEEKQVLIFTMLEGEVLKGLVGNFSRYEIAVHLKGGLPVTLFRHAIFNITDKKKRSYLKNFQEIAKDWQKSPLYIIKNS